MSAVSEMRERVALGISVLVIEARVPCTVAVKDPPIPNTSMFLDSGAGRGFQLAELQEPWRKRGLEYRSSLKKKFEVSLV